MTDAELAGRPALVAPMLESRDCDALPVTGNGAAMVSAAPAAFPRAGAGETRRMARRALDVVVSAVLLLCLAPLLLAVAMLIKLDSRGPIIFRQRRLGKDMRPFTVLKFRTMRADATCDPHARYIAALASAGAGGGESTLKKLTNDARVTRVGRTLRRLSIDELPQLVNVLLGDMALVGPRPAIDYELEHYQRRHYRRFRVRPGITGLWQVSGRSALGFNDMLDLDAEYVNRATFGTDVRILAQTPWAALRNTA